VLLITWVIIILLSITASASSPSEDLPFTPVLELLAGLRIDLAPEIGAPAEQDKRWQKRSRNDDLPPIRIHQRQRIAARIPVHARPVDEAERVGLGVAAERRIVSCRRHADNRVGSCRLLNPPRSANMQNLRTVLNSLRQIEQGRRERQAISRSAVFSPEPSRAMCLRGIDDRSCGLHSQQNGLE